MGRFDASDHAKVADAPSKPVSIKRRAFLAASCCVLVGRQTQRFKKGDIPTFCTKPCWILAGRHTGGEAGH